MYCFLKMSKHKGELTNKQNKKKKNRQIPKSISGLGHSAWWFFEGGEQFTRLWLHFCWESNKEKQRSYERKGIQVSKRNRTTIGFTNGKNEDDSSTIVKGAPVIVPLSIWIHQPRQQYPGNWSQDAKDIKVIPSREHKMKEVRDGQDQRETRWKGLQRIWVWNLLSQESWQRQRTDRQRKQKHEEQVSLVRWMRRSIVYQVHFMPCAWIQVRMIGS